MQITINKGDTIFTGKWKNKKQTVKSFGKDDKGQPMVNGKKVLAFRMEKFMKKPKVKIELKELLNLNESDYNSKILDVIDNIHSIIADIKKDKNIDNSLKKNLFTDASKFIKSLHKIVN